MMGDTHPEANWFAADRDRVVGASEQGLIDRREYVTRNIASVSDMVLKPAHAKFAGIPNFDNGNGAIRGSLPAGATGPSGRFFEGWMKPFWNLGMISAGHDQGYRQYRLDPARSIASDCLASSRQTGRDRMSTANAYLDHGLHGTDPGGRHPQEYGRSTPHSPITGRTE